MVRWTDNAGVEGHYSVSLWEEDRQWWFYYDLNLNGFLTDDATGRPLAPSDVRTTLLTGGRPAVTAHPSLHDYTIEDLRGIMTRFPVEFYDTLSALPRPWDRFVDNLTGHRDRRLVVRGRILVGGLLPVGVGRAALLYLLTVTGGGVLALLLGRRGSPKDRTVIRNAVL